MKTDMSFTKNTSGHLVYMTAPNIPAVHAFTTRYGGVSHGALASLNLGQHRGDDPENVRKNYIILCSALGLPADRLVISKQVHGTNILIASSEYCNDIFSALPYEADGLITAEENLPLFIYTADCIPILLHDPVRKAIGAVHAGWRGTMADIAGIAVRKMKSDLGCCPGNIQAAIGPGIGQCCFETDGDVAEVVTEKFGDLSDRFIKMHGKKYSIDLKEINRYLLAQAGISEENISVSNECTMCNHDKYWSHRFTKGVRGSQASVIMLKGTK